MPIADEAFHVMAMEALLGRRVERPPPVYADLVTFYRRYTMEVALPALSAVREDRPTVYDLIRKAHEILFESVAAPDFYYCNQNPHTLQAFAMTSMLFCVHDLREEGLVHAGAGSYARSLVASALRDHRAIPVMMAEVLNEMLDPIWERMPADDEATMYTRTWAPDSTTRVLST